VGATGCVGDVRSRGSRVWAPPVASAMCGRAGIARRLHRPESCPKIPDFARGLNGQLSENPGSRALEERAQPLGNSQRRIRVLENDRFSLIELDADQHLESLASEARAGLTATPKRIPCRFFYDEIGSQIFEEICEQPEYYLTRAESEILRDRAEDVARRYSLPISLVELGSGSSTKTRLLIEALLREHGSLSYVPIDISPSVLEASALQLLDDYKHLEIHAIAGDYQDGLHRIRRDTQRPKLILWLGSSIGNLDRPSAEEFVSKLRGGMNLEDRLLLGIDLRKDRDVLESAYDDSSGVTARFNRNLLARINRELGGRFDPETFDFRATYDEVEGNVVSFLRSRRDQTVRIEGLGLDVEFAAGETIHTENSFKYSWAEIEALARCTGFAVEEHWLDAGNRYSVNLFAPVST
jgi:L-histidine N-alpha-methyltransferase